MFGLIDAQQIASRRLVTRVLMSGPPSGEPVIFLHGNLSSADWWKKTMTRLPPQYRGIAPDLRGYGAADRVAKIDATRGMGDFSDDLAALLDALEVHAAHIVGHSLGGAVVWRFMADHPDRLLTVTQICPGSPFGFGGCKTDGRPCFLDGAGSGAGAVNADLIEMMATGERGGDHPSSPRAVLNGFVWKAPFVPEEIETLLSATLAQHLGPEDYPGDHRPSGNWPFTAPGLFGPINAMSPIYQEDPLGFLAAQVPLLWIRGAEDPIVSDASLFDMASLGRIGLVPGWPGPEVVPPQPMVRQTDLALTRYEAQGGRVVRVVLPDCGHSPFIEKPIAFDAAFHAHISG